MVVRVWDVLVACETARSAYLRVLSRPTMRMVAQNAILLLLWLETTMGFDLLENVANMSLDDSSLALLIYEANALYNYVLHCYYGMPPPFFQGFQTITTLCGGRLIDYGFFIFHKDVVARGLTMIRDNVGSLLFNDTLYPMLLQFEADSNSSWIPNPVPAPELTAPFVGNGRTSPEDARTSFVAFPECHPLSSQQILDYFERTLGFGHCIERVATEQPACPGQSSRHGIIVFRTEEMRDEAMLGEPATFFRVDGHDMWVHPYEPPC